MKRERDQLPATPQDDSRRARIKRVRDFLKVWRDVRGKDDTICITGAATVLRTSDLLHVIETIDIAQELLNRAKERGELMEVPQFAQSESARIGWIAVSERLPETNGEYLVCIKPLLDKQSIVKLSLYEKQASPVISGFRYAPVTHWMPLPEPMK